MPTTDSRSSRGPLGPRIIRPLGPRAVLWDLDGTLADSSSFHLRSWRAALSPIGIEITDAQFLETFGRRNEFIVPLWLGARATPRLVQELADAKEALYRAFVEIEGLTPLPGASEWVHRLHDAGWKQAIGSSAPRRNVDVMVDAIGLASFFEATAAAEDVAHGKPAPDVFLAAAKALGVPPERCVVVEDAAAGIEAARRAGIACIGVGENGTDAADLRVRSLDLLPLDAFEQLLTISPRRT